MSEMAALFTLEQWSMLQDQVQRMVKMDRGDAAVSFIRQMLMWRLDIETRAAEVVATDETIQQYTFRTIEEWRAVFTGLKDPVERIAFTHLCADALNVPRENMFQILSGRAKYDGEA